MKRVKGVEDLNICIIGAQGIVGVGAIIRMPIASCRAAVSHQMDAGFIVFLASSFPFASCHDCIVGYR